MVVILENEHFITVLVEAGKWARWEEDGPSDKARWHLIPKSEIAKVWLAETFKACENCRPVSTEEAFRWSDLRSGALFISVLLEEKNPLSRYAVRLPSKAVRDDGTVQGDGVITEAHLKKWLEYHTGFCAKIRFPALSE